MSIVLQSRISSAFIESPAVTWTERTERAHVFATSLAALQFCFDHELANMQILARFRDPKMNFAVPVGKVPVEQR